MGIVYHGSKHQGMKRVEPRKSTHGVYVYATPDKALALIFSGKCGDDLTYELGHFGTKKDEPWELVENIPGAFDKMFSNPSSIYTLSDETFKDIHTGFEEVVSKVGVDVLSEEFCENVFEGILRAEKEGLVKIYRYPNKPKGLKQDGTAILDKWRHYKKDMNKEFSKEAFDRLFYLHPELMEKINELAIEFGYDYHYKPEDIIELFDKRIQMQLFRPDYEQFVDCSYISICNTFPELKPQIDVLYNNYKSSVVNTKEQVL